MKIHSKTILRIPSIFLGLLAVLPLFAFAGDKPNILFVYTDDQATFTVSSGGHPHANTPNMDRLVNEGANLVNSFTVTPVCSPSRASLMCSKYGSEVGITDWIHPKTEPDLGLDTKVPTFPVSLKKAGYKTGLVGKWHLGLLDSQHPTLFGFDYFMGNRRGGWTSVNPTLEVDGKDQKFEGLNADVLGDHAVKFLKENKETISKNPSFLFMQKNNMKKNSFLLCFNCLFSYFHKVYFLIFTKEIFFTHDQ